MPSSQSSGLLPRTSAPPGWQEDAPVPYGPVLQDSFLDEDIPSLADLAVRYPPPPGYGYALTEWGQPVVVHHATGTRFSLLVEEETLAFDWKVTTADGYVFRTVEIERDGEVFFPDDWPLGGGSEDGDAEAGEGAAASPEPEPEPELTSAQKMLETVRHQLRYGTTWAHRDDRSNYEGVSRALREEPERAVAIISALGNLLTDENRRVRSGAVALLPEVGEQIGEDRLLEVLELHRELYDGVKTRGAAGSSVFPDLYSRVLHSLGRVARPGNLRAVRLLRAAAEEGLEAAHTGLARLGADWLCQHAARLVPRDRLLGMLHVLPTALHREHLVRALGPWPPDEREEELASRAWEFLPLEPAEIARLRSILEDGG